MIQLRSITVVVTVLVLSSCAKHEPAASTASEGRRATVVTRDGAKVAGSVKASSPNEITLAGDDGITRTIPMDQVRSVDYGAPAASGAKNAQEHAARTSAPEATGKAKIPDTSVTPPHAISKTHELPVGAEVSVRAGETIDSAKAAEGQTFEGEITRDAVDASGDVVIPRGSSARIVIKSASKGGRFRGASDLVLDLKSVNINGREHSIDTADIAQRGKDGAGINKRTAEYTGGGAALGAIIGAIAGGGKGAAIGAASGAGAGAVTQAVTKGGAIRVPVETVLTFKLDKALRVAAR